MKATVVIAAAAATVAVVPLTAHATAPSRTTSGTLAYTDYTPDPAVLAASAMLHTVTGLDVTNYCQGGRVPAGSQDVNVRTLTLSKRSNVKLTLTTTGAWGLDLTDSRDRPLATTSTVGTGANPGQITVGKLAAGRYRVYSCNLGGAATANVAYTVTPK